MTAWTPIATEPAEPCCVVLLFSNREWIDAVGRKREFSEPFRDLSDRCEMGFWNGANWGLSGAGHDLFDDWRGDDVPSHWCALTALEAGE